MFTPFSCLFAVCHSCKSQGETRRRTSLTTKPPFFGTRTGFREHLLSPGFPSIRPLKPCHPERHLVFHRRSRPRRCQVRSICGMKADRAVFLNRRLGWISAGTPSRPSSSRSLKVVLLSLPERDWTTRTKRLALPELLLLPTSSGEPLQGNRCVDIRVGDGLGRHADGMG
jgi:hypothetical protein